MFQYLFSDRMNPKIRFRGLKGSPNKFRNNAVKPHIYNTWFYKRRKNVNDKHRIMKKNKLGMIHSFLPQKIMTHYLS